MPPMKPLAGFGGFAQVIPEMKFNTQLYPGFLRHRRGTGTTSDKGRRRKATWVQIFWGKKSKVEKYQ